MNQAWRKFKVFAPFILIFLLVLWVRSLVSSNPPANKIVVPFGGVPIIGGLMNVVFSLFSKVFVPNS